MKIYHQQQDQQLFGRLVKSFPNGVGDAFHALIETIKDDKRSYYGISKIDDKGGILYWAAAEEKAAGEAEKYKCERFTIPAGDYLSETVLNWRENTDCIKDVFHEMMQDARADTTKPCIEWYYKDDEMYCMIKAR
jgi:predicted transcriptional regulator YdeE